MPEETLYQGTFYLMNIETGEEVNVAMQIALGTDSTAYTMRGLCDGAQAVTMTVSDPTRNQLLRQMLAAMRMASVPAEGRR